MQTVLLKIVICNCSLFVTTYSSSFTVPFDKSFNQSLQRLIYQTGDQSSQRMEVMLQTYFESKQLKNAKRSTSKQVYLHFQ